MIVLNDTETPSPTAKPVLDAVFDPRKMRERLQGHLYSRAADIEKTMHAKEDRRNRNVGILDIVAQDFKSFAETGTALLTQLSVGPVWEYLEKNWSIQVADFPAWRNMYHLIIQGVDTDIRKGDPEQLAALLEISNPALFARLVEKYACTRIDIATRITRIYPVLGPLHIKINPPKNTFNWWRDILFIITVPLVLLRLARLVLHCHGLQIMKDHLRT